MSNFEGSFNSHISDSRQDAGQIINNPPENSSIKKIEVVGAKIALGVATVGVGMGLVACSPAEAVESTDVVVMTTIEPTDSPAPEMTPAVDSNSAVETNNQTETTGTAKPEKTIDFNELLALAPDVNGLNKETQDNKVLYTYQEGNPYGGEVGEYAGVYKDNVIVEGEKVGGVCMEAKVCQKLLEDALVEIPEGEPKVKVMIPLDVTNFDGDVRMKLTNYEGEKKDWLTCFFDGELTFTSPYPDDSLLWLTPKVDSASAMSTYDGAPINNDSFIMNIDLYNDEEDYFDMHKLMYSLPDSSINYDSQYNVVFGQSMCVVNSSLTIAYSSYVDSIQSADIMPLNALLTIGNGSLVFIEGLK